MSNNNKHKNNPQWKNLQKKRLTEPIYDPSVGRVRTDLNRQQSFIKVAK
jgi:hypothetical protein